MSKQMHIKDVQIMFTQILKAVLFHMQWAFLWEHHMTIKL